MLVPKPPDKAGALRKLGSELRRIRDEKKGLITIKGEKSVSSKLTLVLAAFNDNECAKQTNLNIKSVNITTKNITIIGDTSSGQRRKFFETLRSNGLEILKPTIEQKGGRDHFSIIVEPK